MQFHQAFYQKHGIKVTRDAIDRHKDPEQLRLEHALLRATQNDFVSNHTVQMIEQAIQKYPESDALKNHLYIAYVKTKQQAKAMDCLRDTIKKHPNYVFGILNLVSQHLHDNQVALANQLLTEPYDVRRFEKEEFIHHVVFIRYYQAVVNLALAKKDQEMAEKYHRLMFEYDPTDEVVQQLSNDIQQGRMARMQSRMIAPSVRKVEATPKSITGWEKTETPPLFIHPEVQQLFEYDATTSMPQKLIETLLNLPRETFIRDVENVLAEMVRRCDYYYEMSEKEGKNIDFPLHALYFLTELRAYDSLSTILNILRQDAEFLEFWFFDALHDNFFPTLYRLGNRQLPLLKSFITEPNLHNSARHLASSVAAQVALRQPERRSEVIQWFKEVIQTHLDQSDNDALIDNYLLGDLVVACLNLTAIELEPQISQLFEHGWIPTMLCGDLQDVKNSLHNPEEHGARIEPLPLSIYEMYSGKYSDVVLNPKAEAFRANFLANLKDDPYSSFLMNRTFGQSLKDKMSNHDDDDDDECDYYIPQETVRRVEPKIGRNDPCHCGSGKKYKKCHGA